MTIESWNPGQQSVPDAQTLERMLEAARAPVESGFGLSEQEIAKYAPLMRASVKAWYPLIAVFEIEELIALLKFFTLAEQKLKGWQAAERSPVIPLAKMLREKSAYPDDLTAWIRANSNNRFLPHGSLMDRL